MAAAIQPVTWRQMVGGGEDASASCRWMVGGGSTGGTTGSYVWAAVEPPLGSKGKPRAPPTPSIGSSLLTLVSANCQFCFVSLIAKLEEARSVNLFFR